MTEEERDAEQREEPRTKEEERERMTRVGKDERTGSDEDEPSTTTVRDDRSEALRRARARGSDGVAAEHQGRKSAGSSTSARTQGATNLRERRASMMKQHQTNYAELAHFMGKRNNKPYNVPSIKATTVHRVCCDEHGRWIKPGEPRPVAIQYHTTDVVTFYPDGSVKLDDGAWMTATTKARMNAWQSRASVYQHDFTWYVEIEGQKQESALLFFAGMIITADGSIVTGERKQR